MKMVARSGPYTYDDFCQMVREDQKADLIDGVIYMASPENIDANRLFVWLIWIMIETVRLGLGARLTPRQAQMRSVRCGRDPAGLRGHVRPLFSVPPLSPFHVQAHT